MSTSKLTFTHLNISKAIWDNGVGIYGGSSEMKRQRSAVWPVNLRDGWSPWGN